MAVVQDDVSRIVSKQQELQEHVIQMRASVDELRSAVYNQHDEVMRIVTRQQMLLEQMSTTSDMRWKNLKEPQGTLFEEPKGSSKTYI